MLAYKIKIAQKAKQDIKNTIEYNEYYNIEKDINKIYKDIETLKFMLRINKTVYTLKDKNSEYRRMISRKYAIIYKIEKD